VIEQARELDTTSDDAVDDTVLAASEAAASVAATSESSAITRGRFHDLPVIGVDALTDQAVLVTLAVPPALRPGFVFSPGQHLTVRHSAANGEIRRSYSICAPTDGTPPSEVRFAVKRLGEGGFGAFATRELRVGDRLAVMPPEGRFRLRAEPAGAHHVAIAAGSGITPVLSILATALRVDPMARASLIYGNRSSAATMFVDELADLKDRYPERFTLLHVLSREPRESPLLSGRVDAERLPRLLDLVGEPAIAEGETSASPNAPTQFYLCGPLGLVELARATLATRGVPARHVHFELFDTGDGAPVARVTDAVPATAGGDVALTVRLNGRVTRATMSSTDACVLDAVLRARPEAPYSCTGGVCGTCRARLLSGEVVMAHDYALEPDEKNVGFVLACQALPRSEELSLDFDA
jgi:ring-1,2-phenylacetyl-CoA epoxidase subunit PaaE